jgi:hypothetical protein
MKQKPANHGASRSRTEAVRASKLTKAEQTAAKYERILKSRELRDQDIDDSDIPSVEKALEQGIEAIGWLKAYAGLKTQGLQLPEWLIKFEKMRPVELREQIPLSEHNIFSLSAVEALRDIGFFTAQELEEAYSLNKEVISSVVKESSYWPMVLDASGKIKGKIHDSLESMGFGTAVKELPFDFAKSVKLSSTPRVLGIILAQLIHNLRNIGRVLRMRHKAIKMFPHIIRMPAVNWKSLEKISRENSELEDPAILESELQSWINYREDTNRLKLETEGCRDHPDDMMRCTEDSVECFAALGIRNISKIDLIKRFSMECADLAPFSADSVEQWIKVEEKILLHITGRHPESKSYPLLRRIGLNQKDAYFRKEALGSLKHREKYLRSKSVADVKAERHADASVETNIRWGILNAIRKVFRSLPETKRQETQSPKAKKSDRE